VAAIPDAGGARCAPRGVMRASVRVVVLGGLLVAAWLLGSGIGHADEDPGQPCTNLAGTNLAGTNLVGLVGAEPSAGAISSDRDSGGRLGVPPTAGSSVTKVLSALPVPRLPVQPPAKLGNLSPLVNAIGVPKLLTPVLTSVSRPLAGPAAHGAATRWQAPAGKAVTVPLAAPLVRAVAVTAPARAPVLIPAGHAAPTMTVQAAAPPLAPSPASPPGAMTSPFLSGSTGSGASTKSNPDLAIEHCRATADLAARQPLSYLGASDLPRSPATRPAASPD
jgi:hypothetical protein